MIKLICSGWKPIEETEKKLANIRNLLPEKYRTMCFLANMYVIGDDKEYLSSIVFPEEIHELKTGDAAVIFADTGAGKTTAIKNVIESFLKNDEYCVIFLTNRTVCKTKFIHDWLKSGNMETVLSEGSKEKRLPERLEVMTYQELSKKANRYNKNKTLIILDEIHALSEDSTFSFYPQNILMYLKYHLETSIRVYMTATDDNVISIIRDIEGIDGNVKVPYTIDDSTDMNLIYKMDNTRLSRIRNVYLMKNNWDYLDFKFYKPNDKKMLAEYISTANQKGIKSLIYCNDKKIGMELQQLLGDNTLHVYSSEDKKAELSVIAAKENFDNDNLIATKVAENGMSLNDKNLKLVIVETWDLITLKQVIGRARVDRKNPESITVLVPDYSKTDIGRFIGMQYNKLLKVKKIKDNPEMSLEHYDENYPYVGYSAYLQKPVVNSLAIMTLENQYRFLRDLRQEMDVDKHAFVKKVLAIYDKKIITEDMFLGYDKEVLFSKLVNEAFEIFKSSDYGNVAFEQLKKAISDAYQKTGAYKKKLHEGMQVETINEVFESVGVDYYIEPKSAIYRICNRLRTK